MDTLDIKHLFNILESEKRREFVIRSQFHNSLTVYVNVIAAPFYFFNLGKGKHFWNDSNQSEKIKSKDSKIWISFDWRLRWWGFSSYKNLNSFLADPARSQVTEWLEFEKRKKIAMKLWRQACTLLTTCTVTSCLEPI